MIRNMLEKRQNTNFLYEKTKSDNIELFQPCHVFVKKKYTIQWAHVNMAPEIFFFKHV